MNVGEDGRVGSGLRGWRGSWRWNAEVDGRVGGVCVDGRRSSSGWQRLHGRYVGDSGETSPEVGGEDLSTFVQTERAGCGLRVVDIVGVGKTRGKIRGEKVDESDSGVLGVGEDGQRCWGIEGR